MATFPKCLISYICQLMIRIIMRQNWKAVHRSPGIYLMSEENLS
jgi:hypothetical protein